MINGNKEPSSEQFLKDLYILKNNPFAGLDMCEVLIPRKRSSIPCKGSSCLYKKSTSLINSLAPTLGVGFSKVSSIINPKSRFLYLHLNESSSNNKINKNKINIVSYKEITIDDLPNASPNPDLAILESIAEKFLENIKSTRQTLYSETREKFDVDSKLKLASIFNPYIASPWFKSPQKLSAYSFFHKSNYAQRLWTNDSHRITLEVLEQPSLQKIQRQLPKKLSSIGLLKKRSLDKNSVSIGINLLKGQPIKDNNLKCSSVSVTCRSSQSKSSVSQKIFLQKIPIHRLSVEHNIYAGVRRSNQKLRAMNLN